MLDQKARFLIIEFDTDSRITLPSERTSLFDCLYSLGIDQPTVFLDTSSAKYQMYVFFEKQIQIAPIVELLESRFADLGWQSAELSIKKPGDLFCLPLQSGTTWVNQQLTPIVSRDQISYESAISLFVRGLQTTAVSPEMFSHALQAVVGTKRIDFQPPGPNDQDLPDMSGQLDDALTKSLEEPLTPTADDDSAMSGHLEQRMAEPHLEQSAEGPVALCDLSADMPDTPAATKIDSSEVERNGFIQLSLLHLSGSESQPDPQPQHLNAPRDPPSNIRDSVSEEDST